MVEVVKTEKIKGIRAGRPGYSQDVEVSAIPQIRRYQEPAYWVKDFTVPAKGSTTFSKEFEYAHFMTNVVASISANTFFRVTLRTGGVTIIDLCSFQKVKEEFPATFPVDELTVKVVNWADVDVEGTYVHNGIKGLEKIEPIRIGLSE